MTVDSEVGRGTTFRVFLPVAEHVAPEAPISVAAAALDGHETVLVVEDEEAVRCLILRILRARGYAVLEAASAAEALRMFIGREGKIDLLLTDVVMPDMGGRALADRVRSADPATRVVYMSGYTDDAIVRHGIETATDAFLRKPFTPTSLARKVREVLDGRTGTLRPAESRRAHG